MGQEAKAAPEGQAGPRRSRGAEVRGHKVQMGHQEHKVLLPLRTPVLAGARQEIFY